MSTMEELAGQYKASQSMDDLAAQYNPNAVPDNQGVTESQFRLPTKEELPKEVPSFVKTVEMIGSGAMKGSLEFTGRLLSFVEKGTFGTSYVNDAYKYWSDKEDEDRAKYNGAGTLHGLGELPMEMVTTAPVGTLLGATSKLGAAVGKARLYGLQRATQYGVSGGAGGAVLAGMEGFRSGENMGDTPFSTEQATGALTNVGTYIAPMLGTAVSNWAEKANRLDAAKKLVPGVTNRHLNTVKVGEEGVEKVTLGGKIKSLVFDSISNQTGFGHSAKLHEGIGDDVSKWINGVSGNVVAKYSKDYRAVAGKEFQRTLKGMEHKEDELWGALNLKQSVTSNPTPIKDDFTSVINVLNEFNEIPKSATTIKLIERQIKNKNLTLEDVKNIKSLLGSAEREAKGMKLGGTGRDVANEIKAVKDSLVGKIQSELSSKASNPFLAEKATKDLSAATQYSAKLHELKSESNRIKNALFDDVDARAVVKSMVSEAEAISKAKTLGIMSREAQDATMATKVAGALEAAGYPERRSIDIQRFVDLTGRNTVVPELMGETHKAYIGLTNILKSVQESGSHKTSRYLLAGGGVAAAGAIATGGAMPVAGAVVSYMALASLANRSPLKTVFSNLSKKLSPSAYEFLSNKAQEMMTRGGYFMNDEGILDLHPPKKNSGAK